MSLIRRYPELIILTIIAFATRLWGLFTPVAVVFDEVYFKVYAGDYLTGSYYFDPHPPLGKLLLGAWGWISRQDPSVLTSTDPAVVMRVLPAVAGALIIPVFFIFLRKLGASRRIATLGAALLLLDNALLVESRFTLLDSMLILFGLSTVTCFLAARPLQGRARLLLLTASAILAGLSAATKWTGLSALGLIGLIWVIDQVRSRWQPLPSPRRPAEGLILVVVPFLVYVSVFWIHFSLLPKTGQGDAFMSPRFQSTLVGNPAYDPAARMSFGEKFMDLNRAMIQSEHSLRTATHPYGSEWTSWPLMIRPVYFWQGDTNQNGAQGHIYLLGNPVVWWGILIIIIAGTLASTRSFHRLRRYRFALLFLALAYAINFLPFAGIVRVMFIYHYFFALIFSLAFAVILLGALADWTEDGNHPWKFSSATSKNLYLGVLGAAIIGFIYFAPLSYGIPLTQNELGQHTWLRSWR